MEKFFVATAVQGLDLENPMNGKRGISFHGNKSSKCTSREEAEKWAEGQVAQGTRCTYVIFEAISAVKPRLQEFVKEELAFPALESYKPSAGNGQAEEHPDF